MDEKRLQIGPRALDLAQQGVARRQHPLHGELVGLQTLKVFLGDLEERDVGVLVEGGQPLDAQPALVQLFQRALHLAFLHRLVADLLHVGRELMEAKGQDVAEQHVWVVVGRHELAARGSHELLPVARPHGWRTQQLHQWHRNQEVLASLVHRREGVGRLHVLVQRLDGLQVALGSIFNVLGLHLCPERLLAALQEQVQLLRRRPELFGVLQLGQHVVVVGLRGRDLVGVLEHRAEVLLGVQRLLLLRQILARLSHGASGLVHLQLGRPERQRVELLGLAFHHSLVSRNLFLGLGGPMLGVAHDAGGGLRRLCLHVLPAGGGTANFVQQAFHVVALAFEIRQRRAVAIE
eukprot:scaffold23_cov268-Pinguiococcus_pyrenoidosus.AAC.9